MNPFFTIPDPDLSQESSVDPMGLQVIWTAYGQDIFGEKLTTIANDLRVFTFNLFHNHLINRLYQDHTEDLQAAKAYYKTWKTELDVKAGLLMFMEDLVTHLFYNISSTDKSIEKLGILGLSKARALYNSYTQDKIFLSANKRMGVLKNQLNLGMTGRYKGPMMNMLFFDRSFTYNKETWDRVNKFMQVWKPAMELEINLIKLIIELLLQPGKKDYPQLSIQELKAKTKLWNQLTEGYINCFGSRKLPKEIKAYWKDMLRLNSGAQQALFQEIAKIPNDKNINHQEIFFNAKKQLKNEPEELNKINRILDIEPFLSHSEYLLRYLAQPSSKSLKEQGKSIQSLRNEIISASKFSIPDDQDRLKELHRVMTAEHSLEDWLKGVLAFHKKVMEQRGGNMWIELDAQNNIKHYFAPGLNKEWNTVAKYLEEKPWWHRYYLETLRSIYQGLN